jgi:hypothetical protein
MNLDVSPGNGGPDLPSIHIFFEVLKCFAVLAKILCKLDLDTRRTGGLVVPGIGVISSSRTNPRQGDPAGGGAIAPLSNPLQTVRRLEGVEMVLLGVPWRICESRRGKFMPPS